MSTLLRMDAETLPRTLVFTPPLTETEFEVLCRESDNIRFERTKDGTIWMNPPAGGWTSDGNAEIIHQLEVGGISTSRDVFLTPAPASASLMGRS
jgi:hypothetical protein